MVITIFICVVIFLVCVFVVALKIVEEKNKHVDKYYVRIHGQDMCLDQKHYEQYRRNKIAAENEYMESLKKKQEESKQKFINKISILKNKISVSANKCTNELDKMVFEKLLNTEVSSEADYDRLLFMYNNGKLRSNDEVYEYNWNIECQKHIKNFNYERHKVNIIAFFAPFLSVFTIVTIWLWKPLWFISLFISTFLALIAGSIGMIIGYKINLSNAKLYGMSDCDPRVQAEKTKLGVGIASSIGAAGYTAHSAKNAVKDITNVDGWKEFK